MKILFLRTAQAELDDAVEFYEGEQSGLGFRFQSEVSRSLNLVCNFPNAYQRVGKRFRRCLVSKFPYGIIFEHRKLVNEILVVAIK